MVNVHQIQLQELKQYLLTKAQTGLDSAEVDWEACLFAQGAESVQVRGLGLEVVERLLSRQQEDGFVPQAFAPEIRVNEQFHCKPFLAQTLLHQLQLEEQLRSGLRQTVQKSSYARLLPKIEAYLHYYQRNRQHKDGLFCWLAGESGLSTNIAPLHMKCDLARANYNDCVVEPTLLSTDLNCYLAAEYAALAKLFEMSGTGDGETVRCWLAKRNELMSLINIELWDGEINMFTNRNGDTGEFTHMRAWTGFLPVYLNLTSEARAEVAIADNLVRQEQFLRPSGICSMARSDQLYSQAALANSEGRIVANWSGPVWTLPNVLAVRTLCSGERRRRQFAREISYRMLDTMAQSLEQSGDLFANYDAENGRGLARQGFVGWNVLALEMFKFVEVDEERA